MFNVLSQEITTILNSSVQIAEL